MNMNGKVQLTIYLVLFFMFYNTMNSCEKRTYRCNFNKCH